VRRHVNASKAANGGSSGKSLAGSAVKVQRGVDSKRWGFSCENATLCKAEVIRGELERKRYEAYVNR